MLREDAKIKSLQRDLKDDPDVEAAILAILLWSDSTHLATFGTASLWPVYMYLGNLSKYDRGRPNARAAYHMAYIPSVCLDPDLLVLRLLTSYRSLAPRHHPGLLSRDVRNLSDSRSSALPQGRSYAKDLASYAR